MEHRKFNRTSEHRKALFKNMITCIIEHESITTTLPKAKEIRPLVEKVISLGKRYQKTEESRRLHIRRQVINQIGNKMVEKVLTVLAERFSSRNGGYLRIRKTGFRYGDNAPLAVISMVDYVKPVKANSDE
ncbi:MAG: 50S ribosomal protein L17 [Holosporales bacterium]|jgi:large subunit ribosomal protein L17|nr:50S ribosomal protein L17 [Holosporales bacterium]